MLDAVVDTFIPGDTSIPGVGPGGVEGGMRCLLPTIMGEENVDLLVNVMFSLYPDFPTKSYEERAAIMIGLNDNPMTAELFVGLYQATAFAFYSEILGVGPSPCGDPAFPGSFPLIGFPYFTWGASEDEYGCSNAPDVVDDDDDDDYDDDDYDD